MRSILFEGMTQNKGGKESYIMNMFRAFDKTKYTFSFLAYGGKIAYEEEILAAGATIFRIPPRHQGFFVHRKALHKLFAENHFDVVWANKTSLSSCEILEIAKKHKVSVRIVHSHCSSNTGSRFTALLHGINKRLVRHWANEFFACSDTAAAYFFGKRPAKFMYNGIDVERFRFRPEVRDRIRRELELENCFVVGHVGLFTMPKNHKKLIDVFSALKKRREDARLVLCGDGEKRANIEAQIKALDLQDRVLLLGEVDNVNEILQAMDIIVMPSLFEGLPFALIEAQSAGLKCVVSDTVSQESSVLEGNQFLPLTMADDAWAETIDRSGSSTRRGEAYQIIKANGFDIHDCVLFFENILRTHFTS